ncbi:MAG: ABC transporter ATP-binding protein [Pseudonocardiales bacterium]
MKQTMMPTQQDLALVACHDVARAYGTGPTAVVAVYGVTCTVRPGSRIALTGPSGSGKSTLLHLMAGLETPTSGTLAWPALDGHPLGRPGRIGVIFQGPSLLAALDVKENVALPLLLADTREDQAAQLALAALERLDIGELGNKLPEQLSGGQAQRVAVARVLASRPTLILADEPTGQLDHEAGGLVMDVLLQASEELGAAVVVSTHDPLIADRLPVRWTMRDGRMDADASTGDLS